MIGRLASEVFLFVCTGNTCRSPLAEGFFRKMLADRLKCCGGRVGRPWLHGAFRRHGGGAGLPAAPESIEVARALRRRSARPREPAGDPAAPGTGRPDLHDDARPPGIDLGVAIHILRDRVELLRGTTRKFPTRSGSAKRNTKHCRAEIDRNLRIILETLPI